MISTKSGDVVILLLERFDTCGIAQVAEDGEQPSLLTYRWKLHARSEAGVVARKLAKATKGRILIWDGVNRLVPMSESDGLWL